MTTPPLRAIGYLRKSRTFEGRMGEQSWHQQDEAIKRLARERGVTDLDIESDWGKSGGRKVEARRPGWQRVLRAVRDREVDVIFAYDEARLSRSALTLLELYELCRESDVRIILAQGGELDFRNGDGKLKLLVLAGVAEYQRDQASARSLLLARHRREAGEHLGMAFYGDDPNRPEHDWRAVVVAYEEAGAFTGAARLLNERGVPAYRGGVWHAKPVRDVIRHRAPEMIPMRLSRGSKGSSGFLFGGLVRCACGALMRGQRKVRSGKVSVRYECHQGPTLPGHPRPTGMREERLMTMAMIEGTRLLAQPDVEGGRSAHEELRAVVAEQERLTNAYVKGRLLEAEYERQYEALAARAEELENVAQGEADTFRRLGALDKGREPREANQELRRVWRAIRVEHHGGTVVPVEFEWVHPERRGPYPQGVVDVLKEILAPAVG